ncbi:OmpP1/FadL family transporter [Boseongicola aestuarii]|uniref:Outer membrane protein transport protein (OMPP1/FadL/TodX) n=1 Tax=Boseongicola aestuarii TaxID=1470561 RepID=A0A238IV23_9RHOB|nr:hypothetical protein [Boseongicola aestuarii]SMX22299.1 Outer membrane protein transport protein (OMPP1/FadL/TodX) [Boseongicola aestuarii]
MRRTIMAAAALGVGATAVNAGGLERTPQSMAILFEEGRTFELSFGYVSPDVSGTLGADSGDMLASFSNLGLAYKADLNDTLSYAIIFDQPYGADTAYPTGTGNPFAGSTARVRSNALSGVLQYNMGNGASVYGGLRAQSLQAEAVLLPATLNYTINSDTDYELGYLVGAAYERPEIALRVALTYHSETSHDLSLTEASNLDATQTNSEPVNLPQALNLEFQSGVAEDTLVFGSVRWAEWSETEIDPSLYNTRFPGFPPIVFFTDDRITYTLGVGRRLNETWSILGSLSHEETTGSATGNLGPTDGFTSVSLGAVYTKDNMKITGGLRYVDIGDAMSFSGADFQDNSAIAAGVRVGWSF